MRLKLDEGARYRKSSQRTNGRGSVTTAAQGATTPSSAPSLAEGVDAIAAHPGLVDDADGSYDADDSYDADGSDDADEATVQAATSSTTACVTPAQKPSRAKPTRKSKRRAAKKRPSKGYADYPASVTDEEMFQGHFDQITKANIFRLAHRYTIGEICARVLAHHPDSGIGPAILSNRLSRAIYSAAGRQRRPRDEVAAELRAAQQRQGIAINGKRRPNVAPPPQPPRHAAPSSVAPARAAGSSCARQSPPSCDGPPSRFVQALADKDAAERAERRTSHVARATAAPLKLEPVHDGAFRTF